MHARRNSWVFERAARYCPQCLAGDGSTIQNDLGGPWRKTWRLPVVFACTRHARFLEHLCPGCTRPAHDSLTARGASTDVSFKMPLQGGRADLHPTQCQLPLTNGEMYSHEVPACAATLSSHHPTSCPMERAALDLQKHIDSLLDPATQTDAVSVGAPATARQYFVDLRLITQLIRASWPRAQDLLTISDPFTAAISQDHAYRQKQERGGTAPLRTLYDTPPLDAKTCAALLTTAKRLLENGHPQALTDQILHLLANDEVRPTTVTWTRDILVRRPDCS